MLDRGRIAPAATLYFVDSSAEHDLTLTTSPFGWSPAVTLALAESVTSGAGWAEYPGRAVRTLIEAYAAYLALPADSVFLGAGIDGLLHTIAAAHLATGARLVTPAVTFPKMAAYAVHHGADVVRVPMTASLALDIDACAAALRAADFFYVANPNNPTGIAERPADIWRICRATEGLVIVDEANAEFDESSSCLRLLPEAGNLIVLRTFSKAFGLAGLRVGACAAAKSLVARLAAVSPRFAVAAPSAAFALAGLGDHDHLQRAVRGTNQARVSLVSALTARGVWCSASTANCFVMRVGGLHNGLDFGSFCRRRGIGLIRGEQFALPSDCYRVAPRGGDADEALLAAVDAFPANAGHARKTRSDA